MGTVVALSSPLFGDPLATAIAEIESSSTGAAAVNAAAAVVKARRRAVCRILTRHATSELASTSSFMRGIKRSPLPAEVQLTAIGGATDRVVPATSASRPGAQSTTGVAALVGAAFGHRQRSGGAACRRAAIEQRPLPCRSLAATVADEIVATAITSGETLSGKLAAIATGGRP